MDFKVVSLIDLNWQEMHSAVTEFLLLLDKGVYGKSSRKVQKAVYLSPLFAAPCKNTWLYLQVLWDVFGRVASLKKCAKLWFGVSYIGEVLFLGQTLQYVGHPIGTLQTLKNMH